MKRIISILGVTGSIGLSALQVLKYHSNSFKLRSVSAHSNIKLLLEIIEQYSPEYAVCTDKNKFISFFGSETFTVNNTKLYATDDALVNLCKDDKHDVILNAISGKAGVFPSLQIVESGINLALANKESIVCAGKLLIEKSIKYNVDILPVDSEHSAIFCLLHGKQQKTINKIILTASGGPFLNTDKKNWSKISVEQALVHPTWSMGKKITIDSATMANKGLEVIEAKFLFNMPYNKIEVLVHPQSIIHSMIETIDKEIYAQLGPNDMSIPIMNALFYPEIQNNEFNRLDFTRPMKLELLPVDFNHFPMLQLAYEAGNMGGLSTAFYNYTNEYLVNSFINHQITFADIEYYMDKALNCLKQDGAYKEEISVENLNNIDIYSKKCIDTLIK